MHIKYAHKWNRTYTFVVTVLCMSHTFYRIFVSSLKSKISVFDKPTALTYYFKRVVSGRADS